MNGDFFCDVCSAWFFVESDDDQAVCPHCRENVLPDADDDIDDLFGLDHQNQEGC